MDQPWRLTAQICPRASLTETLTTRDLNRALLARQGLLARQDVDALTMIARLAGLQAQDPRPPFVNLWSRLKRFDRGDLAGLLTGRKAVRSTLMRGTLHITTAEHYMAWRTPLAPMLEAGARGIQKNRGVDYPAGPMNALAAPFFAAEPRRFEDVRQTLLAAWPDRDERAMGYTVRMTLPLVSPPEADAEWSFKRDPVFTLPQTWLGAAPAADPDPTGMIISYLAAFGPSSVADAQTWSGLSGLRPAFDALGERLVRFRDERKRELFDLPGAPRPADAPAPARLVDGFDGVMLGHADRARVLDTAHKPLIASNNLRIPPLFLLDGFVAGSWATDVKRKAATLTLKPFASLSPKDRNALEAEAEPLLAFIAPETKAHEVRFEG